MCTSARLQRVTRQLFFLRFRLARQDKVAHVVNDGSPTNSFVMQVEAPVITVQGDRLSEAALLSITHLLRSRIKPFPNPQYSRTDGFLH